MERSDYLKRFDVVYAMHNSYDVLFNGVDADEIMETSIPFFIHDPYEPVVYSDVFETMLEFFEQQEDYEKCANIKRALDGKI